NKRIFFIQTGLVYQNMYSRYMRSLSFVQASSLVPASERFFHATIPTLKKRPRDIKKKNLAKRLARLEEEKASRPDPIMGIPTEFTNSLLRPLEVYKAATDPKLLQFNNYSIDKGDEKIVFEKLPQILARHPQSEDQSVTGSEKETIMKALIGLHNSNSHSIMTYNIDRAISEFGRCPNDTGSAEVQGKSRCFVNAFVFTKIIYLKRSSIAAAIWTVRILNLNEHIKTNRKDKHNYRSLRSMVHKRQKILKYLKRESLERYFNCLKKLGLDHRIIESQIVI
ncbi:4038_t:CDS:2, partial [Acaulospora morrowiae]